MPCLLQKFYVPPESGQPLQCPWLKGKVATRQKRQRSYLPVGEVEVFMHVHLERGGLQPAQADDAILGASNFDIVHCEEPVTVGICLQEGMGCK